jgi:hypothetical protein
MKMITLRHRLLTSASTTETLAKLYRQVGGHMGFEDYHMFLRYVQFDFAKYKDGAGVPLSIFVNELHPEDPQIDRFTSSGLALAVNEIEESQIGKFSFKTKENVQMLTKPNGIENLQLILKLQIVHNNGLIAAILQAHACFLNPNLAPIPKKIESAAQIETKT